MAEDITASGGGMVLALACVRGYGDALVTRELLRDLLVTNTWRSIIVFGKSQFRPLLADLTPAVAWYDVKFPVMSHRELKPWTLAHSWWQVIYKFRGEIDVAVSWHEDVRENAFWRILSPNHMIVARWPENHTLSRNTRLRRLLTGSRELIRVKEQNVYSGMKSIASYINVKFYPEVAARSRSPNRVLYRTLRNQIVLQPFARNPYREWPIESWRILAERVWREIRTRIVIVAAPGEQDRLDGFRDMVDCGMVRIVVPSLVEYRALLVESDALVCLDSFAMHAGFAWGCRVIALFAGDDPGVWLPFNVTFHSAGSLCPHYPCFHRRPCKKAAEKDVCIRKIQVESVLGSVLNIYCNKTLSDYA